MKSVAAILGAVALLSATAAIPASAMTAQQSVEVETETTNADGTRTVVRLPAESVVPGSKLVYTVTFTNDKAEPTNNLNFTLPVPQEVTYVEGTADKAGTIVTVSTDGGSSFTTRGAATVVDAGQSRRATAADITHIRWQVPGPVAPGTTDSIAFKAILN